MSVLPQKNIPPSLFYTDLEFINQHLLQFNPRLENCFKFVFRTVQKDGYNLRYASKELQNNYYIVV